MSIWRSIQYVSFRFDLFRFVLFRFVSICFVSFRSVSFRFDLFRFDLFRFVPFRFCFVSHFTGTPDSLLKNKKKIILSVIIGIVLNHFTMTLRWHFLKFPFACPQSWLMTAGNCFSQLRKNGLTNNFNTFTPVNTLLRQIKLMFWQWHLK